MKVRGADSFHAPRLDERGYGEEGMPQMQTTTDFFKKAIEIDPKMHC